MLELEQIYAVIIAAAPSLSAIIGIVVAVLKNCKSNKLITDKFEEVKTEIISTKEYTELKDQLKIAHQENLELKKKLNELLTKIDHISRTEEE